ncbi:MAG: hypothetical protein AAF317_00410 [Pseudomonadota bacterium]
MAEADVVELQKVDRPAVLSGHPPEHDGVYGANLEREARFRNGARLAHRRQQFGKIILTRRAFVRGLKRFRFSQKRILRLRGNWRIHLG